MDNVSDRALMALLVVVVVEDLKPPSSTPQPHSAISWGVQSEGYATARESLWADNKARLCIFSHI